MKYIIDIPDEVLEFMNGKFNFFIEPEVKVGECRHYKVRLDDTEVTPYTETDELEIRKRAINEVCSKFATNEFYYGDDLKSAFICMAEGKEVGQVKCFYLGEAGDEIRQMAHEEAWEFASMLMNMHPDVAEDIYWSMNGGKGIGVAAEMTYQEAKSKYEKWKAKKDEIRVGDEVIYNSRTKAVVLKPETKEKYGTILTSEFCTISVSHDDLEKTGRHFPEVEKLVKKMSCWGISF